MSSCETCLSFSERVLNFHGTAVLWSLASAMVMRYKEAALQLACLGWTSLRKLVVGEVCGLSPRSVDFIPSQQTPLGNFKQERDTIWLTF